MDIEFLVIRKIFCNFESRFRTGQNEGAKRYKNKIIVSFRDDIFLTDGTRIWKTFSRTMKI